MDANTTCPLCHEAYYGKHLDRCACKRAHDRERANKFTADHPGYYSKYDTADCYEHICPVCGKTFKNHKDKPCHCSVECWQRRHRQMVLHPNPSPCSVLHPKHLARTWAPSSSGRAWVMGWCGRCGKSFVIVDQLEARYCSLKCGKATGKDTRRARKRGAGHEPYRRIDIFERDGWRCHICGRKTRRDVRRSHPLSPTIDHLIPLGR